MHVRPYSRMLRLVSCGTLFFFSWVYLSLFEIPAAYAATRAGGAKGLKTESTRQEKQKTTEVRFQEHLDRLREAGVDRAKLRVERGELEQLDRSLQMRFKETEAAIKNLPSVIRQRHRAFTKKYSELQGTLRSHFDSIDKATTDDEVRNAADKLASFLESVRPISRRQKIDADNLPFLSRKNVKTREPRTREQFDRDFPQQNTKGKNNLAGVFDVHSALRIRQSALSQKPILLAFNDYAGDVPFTLPLPSGERTEVRGGTTPHSELRTPHSEWEIPQSTIHNPQWEIALASVPTADDLSEDGKEIRFTDAIHAKAQELGCNPVKLYEFTRNEISFTPTYGSIQGADQCLQSKQCNAFDTSSLLISLLRSCSIEARYTYSTIELPSEKFKNWAGGFSSVEAAISVFSSAGIPVSSVITGGVITAVQFEQAGVEAWIDYIPSRGARHKTGQGDSWISLDPSYKQFTFGPGINVKSSVPLDSQSFLAGIAASATINESESSCTGVACSSLQQSMGAYKTEAESFINKHHSGASVSDILGKKEIIKQEFPYLLGTLPYKTLASGQSMSELPDSLRNTIEFVLSKSNVDSIRVSKSLAEVAGHKLTLGYVPATQADNDVINNYMPGAHTNGSAITLSELPDSLPAYLINVKSELRIDGELIATGQAIGLGQEENLTASFTTPDLNVDGPSKTIVAGEYYAITNDTGGGAVALEALLAKIEGTRTKLAASDLAGLTREDVLGDLLYGIAKTYFAELDAMNSVRSRTSGVFSQRLPSALIVSTQSKVDHVFGMPLSISMNNIVAQSMNKPGLVQALDGDSNKPKPFALTTSLEASALTGAATQGLFLASAGSVVTPVSAIVNAKDQGIPVYTINQANITAVLPRLQQDSETKADIQNAVNAGCVAVIPQKDVSNGTWTGSGYVIIEPATGEAMLFMTGGISGALLQGPSWIKNSVALAVTGSLTSSFIDLSENVLSSDFTTSLKAISSGVSDFVLSQATAYLSLITSGYFLQILAGEMTCYLDPNTAVPSGACMADLLAGLCIANNITIASTSNSKPVAIAGQSQTVNIGDLVSLDGSGSTDKDNDKLTYSWSIVSKPPKSVAVLYNANLAQISFVADVFGTYKLRLIVSDGKAYSDPVDVTINAGYEMVDVPNLLGKTQQEAETAIIDAGLRIGAITSQSSGTATSGSVMGQKPSTPAFMHKGSTVDITVSSGPAKDTEAPMLDVYVDHSAGTYGVGDNVKVTIKATDSSGTPTVAATIDGVATTITLPDTVISTASFTAGSNHAIEVTATDASNNKTTKTIVIGITDASQTTLPNIDIITPDEDTEITAPTDIIGMVTTPNLMQFTVSYAPVGTSDFTQFGSGTAQVTNGILGRIDPTLLKNGIYVIRLKATDTNDKSSYMDVTYRVKGDMKVGNFTVTFTDLNIPVSGIPITVNRTYDSREKASKDFGIGWAVDIQNTKLDENRTPGEGWPQEKQGGLFGSYCITGDSEHYVSVNLPDGRTEEFDITLTPNCQRLAPVEQTTISYTPRPGTTSTLALKTSPLLLVAGGQLIDPETGLPFDPQGYMLTSSDGMVYDLDQSFGVKTVTDTNGNVITFSTNGITHSAGLGVSFTRDNNGRISKIATPDSGSIIYAYDTNGNLASMTDLAGNVTKYSYNKSHGLTEIKDPRGITPVKNEYDNSGRLVAHTDSYGKRIEYTHDIAGRQEVVKDRLGNLTVYIYDDKGRVLQKTDPMGHTSSFAYDAVGNKTSETDPLGNTTSWTYDGKKNVLTEAKVISGQTITTSHTYNGLSKVLTTTDPLDHVTTNTYDPKGNLLTTTDALGNVTTNTYETNGNLKTVTDARNNTTTYEYDAYGNRKKQTTAMGAVTTYDYDAKGNKLSETDPRGYTTTYTYDANGKLLTVTNAEGAVTKYEYDKAGNKVSETNPFGLITWYYYDSASRMVETEYPDGTTTKTVYDNEGNRIASIDQEGRTTTYEYNAAKQLKKTTYADQTTRQIGYDNAGRQTTVTDALGNVTTKVYDDLGRVIANIDPELNSTTFEFDLNGNQKSQTDPNGHTTTFTYDDDNRLETTTLPGGEVTKTGYDELGRKKSETDAAGYTTKFDYDSNGNLSKVKDAEGGVTQYEYDLNNNRTTIQDARGSRTTFDFDSLNRLITKTMPNGGIETYDYDTAGRQISKTDAKGQTIQYSYDDNGRLSTRSYPDSSKVKFSYTNTGKRQTVKDNRGTTIYAYDGMNRLKKNIYPDGNSINYGYDETGKLATLSSSLTGTVTYSYYSNGRLKEVKDPESKITSYTYDAAGSRTGLAYPNGTTVTYTYDANNRLTNLTHKNGLSEIMASYAYTLGAIGNRKRIDEANGISRQYEYDRLYRLKQDKVVDPANTQTYQADFVYDAVGNRQNKTYVAYNQPAVSHDYTYNNADQLLTENGITYTYDLNGSLATKIDSAGTTTYSYDYDHRLISVKSLAGTVSYQYDGDGNRLAASNDSGTTKYLVDANRNLSQILAEYTANGKLRASYVYADDLISINLSGAVSFYHFDGLGSTRLLSDNNGAVSDTYDFDAFGSQIVHAGTTANDFLFAGQQYDANIGFYYLRARYYQPDNGRFTAIDPFAGDPYAPTSLHKYLYAGNDPVNNTDPSGKETLVGIGFAMAIMGILTALVVRGISLTKAQNNTQSDGDSVYRGISEGWYENPYLIRFAGISSKGMYPYTPSEHIESTKDDTMWISTSGSKEIAQYYASFGRKLVAVIDLNKVEKWRIFDSRKPWNFNTLSEQAKGHAMHDQEVLILKWVDPRAILRVEKSY